MIRFGFSVACSGAGKEIGLRGKRQRQVERLEDECNRGERGGWPDHRNDSADGEKEVDSQYT